MTLSNDDDPESDNIVDVIDVEALPGPSFCRCCKILFALPDTSTLKLNCSTLVFYQFFYLANVGLPIFFCLGKFLGDRPVFGGFEIFKGGILQLSLQPLDPEPVGERGINLEGLPGYLDLLLRRREN